MAKQAKRKQIRSSKPTKDEVVRMRVSAEHKQALVSAAAQAGLELPTPIVPARQRRRQLEVEAGRLDVAQSGCLACHRIGDSGNRGPGENLTHIGSKLSEREIVHAIVDPRAPMPSFRHLPAEKLHDTVRFLAALR